MIDINDRRLIDGETNNLMQVYPLKHVWARDILDKMEANTWSHKQDDLSEDVKQYRSGKLNEGNLISYKKALAFLSNLDGIQFNNLSNNIGKYITSPEVSMCVSRQAWEEVVHVRAYADIVETMGFSPEEVYWLFETDEILASKNRYITEASDLLGKEYSARNFIKAIVSNICLEGIYFFSGFLTFFNLDRQGIMRGTSNRIKHISRDEITHLQLFISMWFTLKEERPELFTDSLINECEQIIRMAVKYECEWGKYIIREGVLGLTDTIIDSFIQDLANQRWMSLGFTESLYVDQNNKPVANLAKWFDSYLDLNDTKTNFFENHVLVYETESLEW
jgi:ribonucleoside-diphosphate reductase beta chain